MYFFSFSRICPPSSPSGGEKEENPSVLAENCFRELLGRATYGNMNNAVRPVFAWVGDLFEKVYFVLSHIWGYPEIGWCIESSGVVLSREAFFSSSNRKGSNVCPSTCFTMHNGHIRHRFCNHLTVFDFLYFKNSTARELNKISI